MKKNIIFFITITLISACRLDQPDPFYTQPEVKISGDLIVHKDGSIMLNIKNLRKLFENNEVSGIEIYEDNTLKPVREFVFEKGYKGMIQLHPGVCGVIASYADVELGFIISLTSRSDGESEAIIIDDYSLLAARVFKDIVLKAGEDKNPVPQNLDPVQLYQQMEEIKSIQNIFYDQYLTFIFENGLPDNLFRFFILQLFTARESSFLELSWNKCMDNDFKQYEIYESRTPGASDMQLRTLITDVNNVHLNAFIPEDGFYFYFLKIRKTDDTGASTNTVGVVRFASGVVLKLIKNQELTDLYIERFPGVGEVPKYFLYTGVNGSEPDAISHHTYLSEDFKLLDFIWCEEYNYSAWSAQDPFTGYLYLEPSAIRQVQQLQSRLDHPLTVISGYRSPYEKRESSGDPHFPDTIMSRFGRSFEFLVSGSEEWFALASLADELGADRIETFYNTYTQSIAKGLPPGINIEWGNPESEKTFIYNPRHFGTGFEIINNPLTGDTRGTVKEVRKGGGVIEQIDIKNGHIKVCNNCSTSYFRAEYHRLPPVEDMNYQQTEQFHSFTCLDCGEQISESHTWMLEENEPGDANPYAFGDNELHWKNECLYCGYRLGAAAHTSMNGGAWLNDIDEHWKACSECEFKLEGDYHDYGAWEPVPGTRVHLRECTVCEQIQVRAHSRWTRWIPVPLNESAGHAKYCRDCGLSHPYAAPGYFNHEPESHFSYNSDSHWFSCTICSYQCSAEAHTFTDWVDIGFGRHQQECTVCGYRQNERHTQWGGWVTTDINPELGHLRRCLECNAVDPYYAPNYFNHNPEIHWSFDQDNHWQDCAVCGFDCNNAGHTLTDHWLHDDHGHWKDCTVCDYQINTEEHNFTEWTNLGFGWHQRQCLVCEEEQVERHKNYTDWQPTTPDADDGHVRFCLDCGATDPSRAPFYRNHDPEWTWNFDENDHWHNCRICDYKCNQYNHNLDVDWGANAEEHWQYCTVCDYTTESEVHTFGGWMDAEDGTHRRNCAICGFEETEDHRQWSEWAPDATDGNLGHSRFCLDCGAVDPSGDPGYSDHLPAFFISSDDTEHWRSCTVCDFPVNRENHDYDAGWTSDDINHWQACSDCGFVILQEEHTFSSWIDAEDGTHSRSCTVCGFDETEAHWEWSEWAPDATDGNLGHSRFCLDCGAVDPSGDPGYNDHEPSFSLSLDDTDHWRSCMVCDFPVNRETHDFSAGWTSDNTNHWQECSVCGYVILQEIHTFGDWIDAEDGTHSRSCTVCGFEETGVHLEWSEWAPDATDGSLGHSRFCLDCGAVDPAGDPGYIDHEPAFILSFDDTDHWRSCSVCDFPVNREVHDFSTGWTSDNTNHWQECSVCGYVILQEIHVFGDWIEAEDGTHVHSCTVCGFEETRVHSEWSEWAPDAVDGSSGHSRFCLDCGAVDPAGDPAYNDHEPSFTLSLDDTDHWRSCMVCDFPVNREAHDFSAGWTFDNTNHWQECRVCVYIIQQEEHTIENVEIEPGVFQNQCSVCGNIQP